MLLNQPHFRHKSLSQFVWDDSGLDQLLYWDDYQFIYHRCYLCYQPFLLFSFLAKLISSWKQCGLGVKKQLQRVIVILIATVSLSLLPQLLSADELVAQPMS